MTFALLPGTWQIEPPSPPPSLKFKPKAWFISMFSAWQVSRPHFCTCLSFGFCLHPHKGLILLSHSDCLCLSVPTSFFDHAAPTCLTILGENHFPWPIPHTWIHSPLKPLVATFGHFGHPSSTWLETPQWVLCFACSFYGTLCLSLSQILMHLLVCPPYWDHEQLALTFFQLRVHRALQNIWHWVCPK